MIVTCGQCQTRFKIPDDKVTDKGVKVRCTKCGNTFRVTREAGQPTGAFPAAAAAPAPGPAPRADPFAKFGAPGEPPPNLELTRPGVFALGVEATRVPDMRPAAPAAPARPPANAFDFSSLVPPAAPAGPAPAPFDFSAIGSTGPAPAPAASPAAFDFAALAAPAPAASAAAFDFSALPPPPDFAPPPAPPAPRAAPAPASTTPAFDFSALGAPPPAPSPPAAPASSQATTLPSTPAFDFSAFGAPPAPPPPSGPTATSSAPWPPTSPSKRTGALPAAAPAPTAAPPDDFFAALPPSETAPHKALLDLPDEVSAGAASNALFDMPAAPPAPMPATEQVPAFAPPVSSPSSLGPAPIVARPPTGDEAPRRKRTALGVVVNVVIAAVLVVALVVVGSAFLNEGKLTREALSFESLKNTFAPSAEFVAADISNGLYETRSGRSVFFVRGEVTNRTSSATRVTLQADIVEGDVVVRSSRGLAGAVPTPEELFALGSGDDLETLATRVTGRATVVEPGASAPFLVVFYEYPPDLKDFRVRVLANRDAAATAQRP